RLRPHHALDGARAFSRRRRARERGRLRRRIREVWDLTRGYWVSEERWSAWILLIAIVSLNIGLVAVNVLLNITNGRIFTALQLHDGGAFYGAFVSIILLIVLYLT